MIGFHEALRTLGIKSKEQAFIGPRMVQIDLTDDCPNNCVGCWARSPFLHSGEKYDGLERGSLDLRTVLDLVDQLRDLGVEHIFFAGGGEPFAHPDIMEIIEAFKLARFEVTINTNLILVDLAKLEWLAELKPDNLIVSLWAGTRETYSAHHPNRTEKAFDDLTERITFLSELKKKKGQSVPQVKLYNVITRYNYTEIPRMIEYGREVGADIVELAAFDPIPRRTDIFLLSPEQIEWVTRWFENFSDKGKPEVWCQQMLRRLNHPDAIKGAYDNGVYYNTPCCAGWDYARITTSGLVHSCLKSHRIPIGSIKEHSFNEIWFSDSQNEFRRHTIKIDIDDPFLKQIGHDIDFPLPGCFRICDNLGANQGRNDQILGLDDDEKLLIEQMHKVVQAAGGKVSRPDLEAVYRKSNPDWKPEDER